MEATVQQVRLAGIAAAVPRTIEAVEDSGYADAETRRRFQSMTGIRSRRLCASGQFTSDLAVAAANRLLDELRWDRSGIDHLILVTQSPDLAYPATACLIQDRLGISTGCAAFDINLGCSGYPYGLFVASRMLSARPGARCLLLVGDTAGKPVGAKREATEPPLFGDAATATALEWDPEAPPMWFQLETDGGRWDAIMERKPGGRPGLDAGKFRFEETPEGIQIAPDRQLKGEDIFNFSSRTVPPAVESILRTAGWAKDTVAAFVFHQANRLINETIRKRLGLSPEATPGTLEHFGNTSSATIPLTMVDQLGELLRGERRRYVLCGFGVGLSWGTVACELSGVVCPELMEP